MGMEKSENSGFLPHDLLLGLLPLLLLAEVLLWVFYLPLGLHGAADFRSFYTGAYMVRTGHASELYNFDVQMRFHRQLVPEASQVSVTMNHPAFEEILFLGLSKLRYRTAFWIFFSVNILLLWFALHSLGPRI